MIQIELVDAAATRSLGVKLGQLLEAGTVLLLEGDLGAGKTSLVQGIGAGLAIDETIDSPTFTLINEYDQGRLALYHLDLYRLEPDEVLGLNLESYWEGIEVEPGVVAIEWPGRLPIKPDDYLDVQLRHHADDRRLVSLEWVGRSGFDLTCLEMGIKHPL
jgi:tRNA threonylcarbamoyladenosine biosynthesis protein TsaE